MRGHGQSIPPPEAPSDAGGAGQQDTPDVHVALASLARAVEALTAAQLRQERQGRGEASQLVASAGEGSSGAALLKTFVALRPPEFRGGADVAEAENWLLEVEKLMGSMGCEENQKVQLGTFLLKGDAGRCWETTRHQFGNRAPTCPEFEALFREMYIPDWVKEQKVYQFIELQQGDMTVAQYEAEFIALSRYAPEIVTPEARKVSKFERSLRSEIRHAMGGV